MAVSAQARKNHDDLFPDHVSTLAVTDPELIEVFDNFAFDEVMQHGDLAPRTRLMVQLAALIATQSQTEFRILLGAALTTGVTPTEAKEIVYQAVPYVGMGRVLDFLHITNEVLTERGVELPLPPQATSDPATRMDVGLTVQQRIVGAEAVTSMYDNAPADTAHIQRYLTGNCFGDHVGRGGIDLPMRELLTFSMLVSLGGADAQVQGHTRANLNVGNDRAKLIDVLTQLLPFIGYPRTLNGLAALSAVAPASEDAS